MGLVPRLFIHHPSSSYCFILFHGARISYRNSEDYVTPQPQQQHRITGTATETATAAAALHRHNSLEQGWYPNKMEERIIRTSGITTNVGDERSRRGTLFIWDYNRLRRSTKGDTIIGRQRESTANAYNYNNGEYIVFQGCGPRGMVW